jgi:cell division protein ZipA
MPELRWILLGAGVLLVAGLWWWETRRGDRGRDAPSDTDRADGQGSADQRESPEKTDSRIPGSEALVEDDSPGLPPIRASRRQGSAAMRNLPIVDIPAGVDPELASSPRRPVTPHVSYRDMQDKLDDMPADLKNLPHDEASEAEQRLPWVRTQPLDRDEIMGKKTGAETDLSKSAAPEERPPDEEEQPARRQRIVALRLIAHSGRWAGRQLVEALEAEGLTYGKYSIFHRERDDGKTIFYVASMVEPGSFDLASIDALDFPGVSVFSVIPGPVDAPTTFDMMLSTARRLSERLKGHLQDEQGSTLTAQRILNLREELVHLEHVAQRVRKR